MPDLTPAYSQRLSTRFGFQSSLVIYTAHIIRLNNPKTAVD